jgi:serine phosphatase RsbU (regulator of sigma subunit)
LRVLTRRLHEVELRQAESARLERGLLPTPLIDSPLVALHTRYRPGGRGVLGGDFYDAVETAPGRLSLLVGDVSGHGVEAAALGVELRASWRALTLAGVTDQALLHTVERVLISERRSDEVFATLAAVVIDLTCGEATVHLRGHPPPLVIAGDWAVPMVAEPQLVLGIEPGLPSRAARVALPDRDWAVLLYTDGLLEGRVAGGPGRLGVDGLAALVTEHRRSRAPLTHLPDWLVSKVEHHNGGPLPDDVAMLLLAKGADG